MVTYETVTKVRTKDGKLFDTANEAETHALDRIQSEVNEIIKKAETHDLKFRDLVAIITALVGTNENALRLYKLLDSIYLDIEPENDDDAE